MMENKSWTLLSISSLFFGIFAIASTFLVRLASTGDAPVAAGNLGYLSGVLAFIGLATGLPELVKKSIDRSYPVLGIIFSVITLIVLTTLIEFN